MCLKTATVRKDRESAGENVRIFARLDRRARLRGKDGEHYAEDFNRCRN